MNKIIGLIILLYMPHAFSENNSEITKNMETVIQKGEKLVETNNDLLKQSSQKDYASKNQNASNNSLAYLKKMAKTWCNTDGIVQQNNGTSCHSQINFLINDVAVRVCPYFDSTFEQSNCYNNFDDEDRDDFKKTITKVSNYQSNPGGYDLTSVLNTILKSIRSAQ